LPAHGLAGGEPPRARVGPLPRGGVLPADRPAALAQRLRPASRVDIEAKAPPDALTATLRAVPNVRRVDLLADTNGTTRCRVEIDAGHDVPPALATCITNHHWPLLSPAPLKPCLADTFLALLAARPGTPPTP